jgi:NitT/TauT family transport system permease protein
MVNVTNAQAAVGSVGNTVTAGGPSGLTTPRRARRQVTWWQPVVVFLILVGLWYIAALYYDKVQQLNWLVPYPHQVFYSLLFEPAATSVIYPDLLNSVEVSLVGLAFAVVIGVAWATIMAQARWAERSLFPYAVLLQCIPILAVAPLLGSIFGFNFQVRVIVTTLIALFPMISNTLFGLQSADKAQRELFQLQGANRWTVLTKLQFPAALPSMFVGLRNAAGLSVIGAIVGDQLFQRGAPGLGVAIQLFSSRTAGQEGWAAIVVASLYGIAVFLIFGLLSRLAVGKWYDPA